MENQDNYLERWMGKNGEKGRHCRQPLNLRPKAGFVHAHLVATARGGIKPQRDLVHITEKPMLA